MQSDLNKLLVRIEKYLEATEIARGTSKDLVNAAPLELHLYNIATGTQQQLGNLRAMIKDAQGTYLK